MKAARGYAPVTVTFQGQVVPASVPSGVAVDTPVGTAHVQNARSGCAVIWEHFPVNADALRHALTRVPDPVLRGVLQVNALLLELDPACGVRPTLPDRANLIDDDALSRAAQSVAQAITAHVTRDVFRTLNLDAHPDTLDDNDVHTLGSRWSVEAVQAILARAGYHPVNDIDLTDVCITCYDDRSDDERTSTVWTWVRQTGPVAHEPPAGSGSALREWLRAHGYAVRPGSPLAPPDEHTPAVRCGTSTAFHVPGEGGNVQAALTDQLTVDGVDVPFALKGGVLLLRGTPDEAEAFLTAHQADVGAILLIHLLGSANARAFLHDDTVDHGSGRWYDGNATGQHLTRTLVATFFPQRAGAAWQLATLEREWNALAEALDALEITLGEYAGEAHVRAARDALRARITANRAEADALRDEHRLQTLN